MLNNVFRHYETSEEMQMKPLSIVIIGKDSAWSIDRLLTSIVTHIPADLINELIYVDSASTDNTVQIVKARDATILRLAPDECLCAAAGRYVGGCHATGEYIFFLDSDMELFGGWVEKALRTLDANSTIGVITGDITDVDRALTPSELPPADCSKSGSECLTNVEFGGSAAIFRRSVLDSVGSWNPGLISDEEPELCSRIRAAGYRILRIGCPITRHYTVARGSIRWLTRRRRARLFLGYGQRLRICGSPALLWRYLRERGYFLVGAITAIVGLVTLLFACFLRRWEALAGLTVLLLLVLIGDAIRVRSFYRAVYHFIHRAFILEGTVRGLFIRPRCPEDYSFEVIVESSI
jgi:glycosyltransferase involved in cell wall biosynthesis